MRVPFYQVLPPAATSNQCYVAVMEALPRLLHLREHSLVLLLIPSRVLVFIRRKADHRLITN